jgi:hypothetical protein
MIKYRENTDNCVLLANNDQIVTFGKISEPTVKECIKHDLVEVVDVHPTPNSPNSATILIKSKN